MMGRIVFLLVLMFAATGCGKCPDGTEPNDQCTCDDTQKTQLDASTCTPKGADGETGGTPGSGAAGVVFSAELDSTGDWQSDNLEGLHQGNRALHPKALFAGDSASMTFDCAGKEHTQLSFAYMATHANHTPITQAWLDVFVDSDELPRETFGGYNDTNGLWRVFNLNVPSGMHTYTFVANSEIDIDPPFVLDTFVCRSVTEEPAPNQVVDFDDGFIPTEVALGADRWSVDNTRSVNAGEAAIHPPALAAGSSATMTFDCAGADHTQLSFAYMATLANHHAQTDVWLELFVDDAPVPREVFGGYGDTNGLWRQFNINVPSGAHIYTLTAHAEIDIGPPFLLDTFSCRNEVETAAPNQRIDFDDGFVPIEIRLGSDGWSVDNTRGVHAGEAAIHPPTMSSGDTATMTLHCPEAHGELSFAFMATLANHKSTSEVALDVFMDSDVEPMTTLGGYGDTNGLWREPTFSVPTAPHTYTFTVRSEIEIGPPFLLDTFACK